MKYAPLILSLSCLISGVVLLAIGQGEAGSALVGAFVGQFAPSAHTAFQKAQDE